MRFARLSLRHCLTVAAWAISALAAGAGCDGKSRAQVDPGPSPTTHAGSTLQPADECNTITTVGVHRFLNPANDTHFYTKDLAEGGRARFKVEHQNYFRLATANRPGFQLLYRCVLPKDLHFYTTNSSCEGAGRNEGELGYVSTTPKCGAVPLYRLVKAENGDHFYTISDEERDAAVQVSNYTQEQVVGYVWPKH